MFVGAVSSPSHVLARAVRSVWFYIFAVCEETVTTWCRHFCLQFPRILCLQCAKIFCLRCAKSFLLAGCEDFLGGCVDILFAVWGFILFEAWDCILCHESEFILFAVHFILRDEQLFVICG